jgi:hypothetical protein
VLIRAGAPVHGISVVREADIARAAALFGAAAAA